MPRFYFDVRLGDCIVRDNEGTELQDMQGAVDFALDEIRELLMTRAGSKITVAEAKIDICDTGRHLLISVPFAEALTWNVDPPK